MKIEDIVTSKEILDKIDTKLSECPKSSELYQYNVKKRYVEYLCACGQVPIKKISYDVGDAWLVERYCDSCYSRRYTK